MNDLAKKYGAYERQKELLDMLKTIHPFLENNGIKYSLCGGTLLGAIRHNGFIPWDDDVDIMVDRNNYEKLVELFESKKMSIGFQLKRVLWVDRIQKNGSEEGTLTPTIDVFVMDNCPDTIFLRKFKIVMIMLLQGMMKNKPDYHNKSLFYKICLFATFQIGRFFSDEFKYNIYSRIAKIGNSKKTKYITGYTDSFKLLTLRYSGGLFRKFLNHRFEDMILPITAEYDNYLTTQYGDYMTPPPESERVLLHSK